MNLNLIRPKNETEDLLLSITKNCEMLIKQTHTKPQGRLEFKVNKSREIFHFKTPISIEASRMIGLTSLEVYNSVFNTNTTNKKFEFDTDNFDEFSFEEIKDELEKIFNISDSTPYHLHHEKTGPRIIEAYKKLNFEKSSTDGYFMILVGYARSPFRDFESYLRIVVGLDEDGIQLILKPYIANFVIYELDPGIYTIKDLQEALHPLGHHDGTLQMEYDDISMKTKLISTRFGSLFGALRFVEKSFFIYC